MKAPTTAEVSTGSWQELPYEAWHDTIDTLHMKLQIIGKLRLALSPFEPQWANVPLYLTARGFTTSPISTSGVTFEVQVDLLDHAVVIQTTAGEQHRVGLKARPVAEFYREFVSSLDGLGIKAKISPLPSEVENPIPFAEDYTHKSYDHSSVTRFFHVLSTVDLVLKEHRAHFRGRSSLVQFFWGSFDLALSRFSGRFVEPPSNAGSIYRLGGDAELICVGFWPGSARFAEPAFFGYEYPKPAAIDQQGVRPSAAKWSDTLGEFVLPYEDVRSASSPRQAILEFCESVYDAGARLTSWDPQLLISR